MSRNTESYSAQLRDRCEPIFDAFWQHPFLEGMRDGTLAAEKVVHYVAQDHQYLTAYMRCYGLGIAASPDRSWMSWFHDNLAFVLADETHPHHALCRAAGVTYDEVQVERLAPSAQAYIDHMMESARDSLGVLLAALLPCPWTYIWSGTRFLSESTPDDGHPFADWWRFYGSEEINARLAETLARFDLLAADAGNTERRRMAASFEASCHHEVRFWEMAWTLEDWTLPTGADRVTVVTS